MFLFLTSELLTKEEMKVVKRHFTWEAKNIPSDKTQLYSKIKVSEELKAKQALRQQSLNEIAEVCLDREFGLKRYAVIRYLSWGEHPFEFMIDRIELMNCSYYGIKLMLIGSKLRQNGRIGSNREAISLHRGFIERRLLDGSWHSIIPTNPIWTGE